MRKKRKDEHIENYLRTEYVGDNLLTQVYVEPESLPELSVDDIDTTSTFCGKSSVFPLMINAMTGGTEMTESINQDLSMLAHEFLLPMQVGSQRVALEDPEAVDSFSVVRQSLDHGHTIIGNLGAMASVEEVAEAMDMIKADALGIHLNVSQELTMKEGDRDFHGVVENLRTLNAAYPGKLIVKEIGFGMSEQTGRILNDIGVSMIDVSGAGGTNFVEIEDLRRKAQDFSEFYRWGIPTAKSIINVRRACPEAFIIASGGIRTATDIINALILGADYTAISGELLRYLLMGGYDYAREYLESLIYRVKVGMVLLGCRDLDALKRKPYRLTGRLAEIVEPDRHRG